MKKLILLGITVLLLSGCLTSCGGNSGAGNASNEYQESYSDSDYDSSDSYSPAFSNAKEVYNYLNGKTFSGDGLNIRFQNYGHTVDVNGQIISNDVKVFDIGRNENGVSYATVQITSPSSVTTTFALSAMKGHAVLVDPNDGTIYEY